MSLPSALAQNSNVSSVSDDNNFLSQTLDFIIKYVYENPLEISPFMKRYSLIAIHIVMILLLFAIIPDKMIYLSYVSAFWLAFIILMVWLTDNLYDIAPI